MNYNVQIINSLYEFQILHETNIKMDIYNILTYIGIFFYICYILLICFVLYNSFYKNKALFYYYYYYILIIFIKHLIEKFNFVFFNQKTGVNSSSTNGISNNNSNMDPDPDLDPDPDPDPKKANKIKTIMKIIGTCLAFSLVIYLSYQVYIVNPKTIKEFNWVILSSLTFHNYTFLNIDDLPLEDWVFIRQHNLFSWLDTSYSLEKLVTLTVDERQLIRTLHVQDIGPNEIVFKSVADKFFQLPLTIVNLVSLTVEERELIRALHLQDIGSNETVFQSIADKWYLDSIMDTVTVIVPDPRVLDGSKNEVLDTDFLTVTIPNSLEAVQRLYDLSESNVKQIILENSPLAHLIDQHKMESYYTFMGVNHPEGHCYVPFPSTRPGPIPHIPPLYED